ncbi:MAG: 16S rRNA (cytosine(1402)-N(4))-methyltransferase RsmH [Patescibacteria group bacterium]
MPEHIPVLLKEVIDYLDPKPGENYIDATVGLGGHSRAILEKTSPSGKLLGFDRDPEAIKIAGSNLKSFKNRFELLNDNFVNIENYEHAILFPINGILLDLGVSSLQISGDDPRGFSFKEPKRPLDMRMDPRDPLTAADILNKYPTQRLTKIFKEYGEERFAKENACRVVQKRKIKKFVTVQDLLEVIDSTYKNKPKPKRIHPATKIFQALRIEVNQELESLEKFLPQAFNILPPKGRLAIISFHSLEDRIVKNYFREEAKDCHCPSEIPECRCDHKKLLKIITKKPIVPSEEEINKNPKSRSAKLRIAEKL